MYKKRSDGPESITDETHTMRLHNHGQLWFMKYYRFDHGPLRPDFQSDSVPFKGFLFLFYLDT